MVDAINQVGLNITLAIAHDWLFNPLQFLGGLEPKEAASLKWSLEDAMTAREGLLNSLFLVESSM